MAKRNIIRLNSASAAAFTLIGISSHENDYRLSWNINEQLGLAFAQGGSVTDGAGAEFACFVHKDDDQKLMLVSNRCDNGFMLEKYKNIDFIMKFDTGLTVEETSAWLRNLRKVPLISAVFPIPVDKRALCLLG